MRRKVPSKGESLEKVKGLGITGAVDKFVTETAINCYSPRKDAREIQDDMADKLDSAREYAMMLEEHLVSYKKLRKHKDIDTKLKAIAQMCPDVYLTVLATGDAGERLKAANSVMDRVQGKPIERTMNMNMIVENKTEAEIDNELKRLAAKLNGSGAEEGSVEIAPSEGTDPRRDESR